MIYGHNSSMTQEQAEVMVRRMIRNQTPDHIIRDMLIERGFVDDEAIFIIRNVRSYSTQTKAQAIREMLMPMCLAILSAVIAGIMLFLLIAPHL